MDETMAPLRGTLEGDRPVIVFGTAMELQSTRIIYFTNDSAVTGNDSLRALVKRLDQGNTENGNSVYRADGIKIEVFGPTAHISNDVSGTVV